MTADNTQAGAMILGTIVFAIAMVGFLRGTSSTDYDFVVPLREVPVNMNQAAIGPAVPYLEMRNRPRSRPVLPESIHKLEALVPSRTDPVQLEGSKTSALAQRMARRAYDGAPPVIPHPVAQRQMSECPTCHQNGIRFGALASPPFPHANYASCTQCHAMAEPTPPWGRGRSEGLEPDPRDVENSFVGHQPPTQGARWTSIAPPAIPHNTWMRERCISCHGPNGRNPLRSTHPQRQSCSQCHVRDSTLEQRPGGRK